MAAYETGNALDDYTKDFERLQAQKAKVTGGVEARILTNLAFLCTEQYVTYAARRLVVRAMDSNKLHLVFNLAGRLVSKVVGRLCAMNGVFKARPDHHDPKAIANADVVDKLTLALDEKVGQPTKTWELIRTMAVCGVAFEQVTWSKDSVQEPLPQFDEESGELLWKSNLDQSVIPQSQRDQMIQKGTPPEMFTVYEEMQLTGDVNDEILHPLQVFVDSSVRSIQDLSPDQSVYVAKIRTVGWIEQNFPEIAPEDLDKLKNVRNLKIISTTFSQAEGASTGNTYLADLIPRVQGTLTADDPDMVVVVEKYMGVSAKNPHGKYCVFVPGIAVLLEGDNPYEEIPIVDFHWGPTTETFWSKDFLTDLIPPQRFLNKRMSQLGEQANASIYANELLGPGLRADNIPPDYPSPIENALTAEGIKLVQRRDPPQLPTWFLNSIELTVKLMREIAGGADLFDEGRFPGQLRGPLAVPMLQEIMDTEWGPLYEHIGERLARVKQMRINRVKQFYPPYRTLHYTGPDMRDEVFVFHKGEILEAGVEYRITVERGSLLPEIRALREDRLAQRLSGPLAILYTDERTGKLDKSKIAAELHYGEAAREDREVQARKLALQLMERIEGGEQIAPWIPLPFWDHAAMMDEYEGKMQTTEFLSASPTVQQGILGLWQRGRDFLSQMAEAQQNTVQNQMIQGAVAQATQQAAAKAAAAAVDSALGQVTSAAEQAPMAQEQLTHAMVDQHRNPPPGGPRAPR